MMITIPVSVGELVDRITILELKLAKASDGSDAWLSIRSELTNLHEILFDAVGSGPWVERWLRDLRRVNELLWRIEDNLRAMEARGDFGPTFVASARSVYKQNDIRSELKREINKTTDSEIREFKFHDG
jgi:hypothetical protein